MGRAAVAALAALVAGPLSAQEITIDPRVGIALPVSSLADDVEAGLSFGLGVAVRVHPRISLRVDGALDELGGETLDLGVLPGSGGTVSVELPNVRLWRFSVGAEVDVIIPGLVPLTVVLNAGGGFGSFVDRELDQSLDGFPDISEIGTSAAAEAGLRVGYDFSRRLNVFVGGHVVGIFARTSSEEPTGGTLWMVPVTAGFRVRFF
ncbi:MAG: hypothetical protein ABFS34_06400 [Gemmatimonadota bacterium]